MNRYEELKVWKESIDLAVDVFEITKKFPKEEQYGLTSQIRRSGISVPSNIAEGAGRNSPKEFRQFLGISNGSASELDTQLIIANRLSFISNDQYSELSGRIDHIQNMTYKLQQTLK